MKVGKLVFTVTLEIVMRVPDDTPVGPIPDADSASTLEELKQSFKGDPSTTLIASEVISADVVSI